MLVFNHSDNVPFDGNISGSGGLTKDGTGTLTLGVANTYGGVTLISAGMLKLGKDDVLPDTSKVTVAVDGTLNLKRSQRDDR